jgi:hypothetical protein
MFFRSTLLGMTVAVSTTAFAGPRDHAYKMHNRLTGVPPTKEVLDQMTDLVSQNKQREAAKLAMDNDGFYSVYLKNLVSPWVNKESKRDFVLNDFTATVIGMIRDDADFSTVLTHDYVYVSQSLNGTIPYSIVADNPATANVVEGNEQYRQMDIQGVSYKTDLVKMPQSNFHQIPPAGIQTLRGFGEQFYFAGTNRAPLVEITKTFLCRDIDTLADNTRSDQFVRRDVPRSPGGEPLTYLSKCSSCHAGMDPLTKAYAFIDWSDTQGLVFQAPPAGSTPEQAATYVRPKMVRNDDVYPGGYKNLDDKWLNLWIAGSNANVGWRGPTEGSGFKDLGAMLVNTDSFDSCMPKKVYESLCLVSADTENDKLFIKKLSKEWKDSGYKMKDLISSVAAQCLGRDAGQ